MTKYKIGCCFFINENDKLIGILTDGDIRRLLINDPKIIMICEENINKDYYYESYLEKYVCDCSKTGSLIPIIVNNRLIGIVKSIH